MCMLVCPVVDVLQHTRTDIPVTGRGRVTVGKRSAAALGIGCPRGAARVAEESPHKGTAIVGLRPAALFGSRVRLRAGKAALRLICDGLGYLANGAVVGSVASKVVGFGNDFSLASPALAGPVNHGDAGAFAGSQRHAV